MEHCRKHVKTVEVSQYIYMTYDIYLYTISILYTIFYIVLFWMSSWALKSRCA